ncbi:MAG: chromosome segregation protein SMC [Lachnospiraceae bacterium]|nr:chromosome segregation protein SMC [Lachnospiraceae bacterium]
MYLKSIEIQGFKSFANRIELNFKSGITGIVGPNGSGKSNVADAVRWVLGEQSAKELRGASMQDVIFSGTETRKPMGFAYVAICLDNSDHALSIDYDEVTVARRVYRSGESEYLINGNACRLRDIEELFYDTGIGQEGYSIIGQGQIDKILSGKAEERRELFDEAAGIVKFKRRKAAALKKLAGEKDNLVRVNDIISELEKQVGPLEEQSAKAKVYISKKEELKKLDINVFLLETDNYKEQMRDADAKKKIAESDLAEAVREYDESGAEYEKLGTEIEELDSSIEEKRNEIANATLFRGQIEGNINVLKEKINSINASNEHFTGRIGALKKDREELESELVTVKAKKAEADERLKEGTEGLDEVKEELAGLDKEISELNSSIENDKSRIIETLNARSGIQAKIGRYETMLEQAEIRKSELSARVLRSKTDEETLDHEISDAAAALDAAENTIHTLEDEKAKADLKLGSIGEELAECDRQHRALEIEYHEKKSKLESLKNMAERYEGYGGAIRKVMEQKNREKGICGVVADLLTVEAKYEVAIETALGGAMQNIVTRDEATAKRLIALLKQEHAGRATFLPLTSIQPRNISMPDALREEGAIGSADKLVKIESQYAAVAANLLGAILVVDNMDHALQIARKYRYRLRIVTVGGEVLNPGGSISGGAYRSNNAGLLGRQREIEALTNEGKAVLKNIDKVLMRVEELRDEEYTAKEESTEKQKAIQEAGIARNTAALKLKGLQDRKNEREEGTDGLKRETAEIEAQIHEITESKAKVGEELSESERIQKELTEHVDALTNECERKDTAANELRVKINDADKAAASLIEAQKYQEQELMRIESSIRRCDVEIEANNKNIRENTADAEEKQREIADLQQKLVDDGNNSDERNTELNDMIQKKEELSKEQKELFGSREKLADKKSGIQKEIYRIDNIREKAEDASENLKSYMWDEYEMTPSDAESQRNPEDKDLAVMKKSISSLKNDIRDLGAVNVNAIEDYKNLMERYTFMDDQRNDLVKAADDLEKVIADLDDNMKRQFAEKFSEIGEQYDIVFKELFGGGKGTLELVDNENLLETDIRIIAQPPGKKLQNMMQLSGGEKALSAIALLFAIQNLKPSPFCLLDEIEAALDEANVDRFASYLTKLTNHTQFIVITHRRGTMVKADRLYGITMQEKGVSTQVNVDLTDEEYA